MASFKLVVLFLIEVIYYIYVKSLIKDILGFKNIVLLNLVDSRINFSNFVTALFVPVLRYNFL